MRKGRPPRQRDENGNIIYTQEEILKKKKLEQEAARLKEPCNYALPIHKGLFDSFLRKCDKMEIDKDLALNLLIQGFCTDAFSFVEKKEFSLPT